jgi:hypothetical protein
LWEDLFEMPLFPTYTTTQTISGGVQ